MTWLGSASLFAAIVALLCGWSWLGNRADQPRGAWLALQAIGVALIVTVGGLLWIHFWPESIRQDLRCDFSSLRYWWRHPFAAAGLALVLLLAVGLVQRRCGRLAARMGAVAAGTWLLLAVVLWSSAWTGELVRRDYERALRAAYEDPVAAVLGPGAEVGFLDASRLATMVHVPAEGCQTVVVKTLAFDGRLLRATMRACSSARVIARRTASGMPTGR